MKTMLNFVKVAVTAACTFLSTHAFSQWTEVALPSRSPENEFVVVGENYFTFQSMGGVFRSTDKGHNWTRTVKGLPAAHGLRDLISFHDRLYVSTWDEGVYMSSDSGESWEIADALPKAMYDNFTVHNGELVTVSQNGRIFMLAEDGTSWTEVSRPQAWSSNWENRWVFSNGQDLLFAIGEGRLYKSDNDGASWVQVDFGRTFHGAVTVYDVAIRDNAIWIAAVDKDFASILLHSMDYGQTWSVMNFYGRGFHVTSVAISDLFIAYVSTGNIYYSADNGKSWNSTYIPFADEIVHHTSEGFLISSPGGVKAFNAATGSITDFASAGINGHNLDEVHITENEIVARSNDLLWAPSEDLFTINKASGALNKIPKNGDGGRLYNLGDIASLQGSLFGQFQNKIYRFNYENRTWIAAFAGSDNIYYNVVAGQRRLFASSTTGLYFAERGSDVLTKLDITGDGAIHAVLENDTLTIISYSDKIFISRGGASTWESHDPDMWAANYTSIAATRSKIFTCTINGLFVSEDNGSTWSEIKSKLIRRPEALLYHDGRLYLGTEDAVLVSPDEGLHWFSITRNMDYFFTTKNLLADETHLYANTMGGGIWRVELEGLYDAPVISGVVGERLVYEPGEDIWLRVEDLVIWDEDSAFPNGLKLIILEGEKYEAGDNGTITLRDSDTRELSVNVQVTDGTAFSNIYEVPVLISGALGVPELAESINFIYPNPTGSLLNIRVKRDGAVAIDVYDLTGRLVQHTSQQAIDSSVALDVTNLVTGVYIFSVRQGDYIVKQKVIKQ